jgi:hypothetical protein
MFQPAGGKISNICTVQTVQYTRKRAATENDGFHLKDNFLVIVSKLYGKFRMVYMMNNLFIQSIAALSL